jgi:hypothetical protein
MKLKKSKKYGKSEVQTLLSVSATTFAIFVSLGFALPIVLERGGEIGYNIFANNFWWIGIILNLGVILYAFSVYLRGEIDNPPEKELWWAYLCLVISYIVMALALYTFAQVMLFPKR